MKANKKFSFLAFANASDSDVRSGCSRVGFLLVGCWSGGAAKSVMVAGVEDRNVYII